MNKIQNDKFKKEKTTNVEHTRAGWKVDGTYEDLVESR